MFTSLKRKSTFNLKQLTKTKLKESVSRKEGHSNKNALIFPKYQTNCYQEKEKVCTFCSIMGHTMNTYAKKKPKYSNYRL